MTDKLHQITPDIQRYKVEQKLEALETWSKFRIRSTNGGILGQQLVKPLKAVCLSVQPIGIFLRVDKLVTSIRLIVAIV